MKKVIVENELTLNTEESTSVSVKDFTQNGVLLRVLVTSPSLDDSFKSCSSIRKQILKEFSASGIEIPYQTVTILK